MKQTKSKRFEYLAMFVLALGVIYELA